MRQDGRGPGFRGVALLLQGKGGGGGGRLGLGKVSSVEQEEVHAWEGETQEEMGGWQVVLGPCPRSGQWVLG